MFNELLERFEKELSAVWSDISDNWYSFLIILVIYSIAFYFVMKSYYKHERENIEFDKNLIEGKKEEFERLKKDNAKYKTEIESKEYQAYKLSIKKNEKNMIDYNMFQKK